MVVRSLFALLSVVLLGVTLSVPAVVAQDGGAGTTQAFVAPLSDWATLPAQLPDTDGEDFNAPLAVTLELPTAERTVSIGPVSPILVRFAQLPPARASPANL